MKQILSLLILMLACLMTPTSSQVWAQAPSSAESPAANAKDGQAALPPAENLLRSASASLLRSPSFGCKVLLSNFMFDQAMTADGYYLNKGQGTGKSKFHFAFGANTQHPVQMTQVCDGHMNYILKLGGEEPTLEFVDLQRIAQTDRKSRIANPTAWMTTGGLSSLMEHAIKSLEFQPTSQYAKSGTTVWHLRGTWKKDALKKFFGNSVNHTYIDNPLKWHKLPGQLPHIFEFHLRADPSLTLVPFQIDFLQLRNNDDSTEVKKVLSIQLDNFELMPDMSDEHFKINNENVAPVEVTELFIERVQQNYSNRSRAPGQMADTGAQQPVR